MLPHGTLAKPEKGSATREHRRKAARGKRIEALHKAASKIRDGHRCQRPGCTVQGVGRVESAHLTSAGMGGRASLGPHEYVTLCYDDHQGPQGVHQARLEPRPLTDAGGNGPIDWYAHQDGQTTYLGRSRPLFPIPEPTR